MLTEANEETTQTAKVLHTKYMHTLEQVTNPSLSEFQTISHQLQTDLAAQLKQFHASLLPNMEKELDEYKKQRLKDAEQLISKIVQRASEDILNKSLSFEDHQKLLIESLEKAKKEGIFG